MTDNITIRLLTPADIYPEMLESFNRKQMISDKWVKNGDCYELVKTDEVREWSSEKRVWLSQYLLQQVNSGGFVAGAFSDNKLVGFSCLDGKLQGISEKYVNLTMLFVDDEWKRNGIGKKLFKQMCLCAEQMKADKMFISAIPSYDTLAFYFNLGCVDAQCVVDSFVDTENDRYLEYNLRGNCPMAETERLILRRYKPEDLQDLFEYLSDKEVVEYEPYKPLTIDEAKENLQWRIGTVEMIAVELKDSHKMIGNVYLGKREFDALEIGFVFNRKYWGNGYAAESCRALMQRAFSNGIHRIFAECDPKNTRSWKLLETLGFQREANLRKNVYFWKDEDGNPIWKDTYIYGKLSADE